MDTARTGTIGQAVLRGAIWGVAASLVMAMYAMIASAALGQGFLTPLYGIASPLIGEKDMMDSMIMTHISIGPMLLGAAIHMLWGALYGIIFGLVAQQFNRAGQVGMIAGIVYGLLVMVVMMVVVLPIVGTGGMPQMVGFSFGIEHVIFGMALGLWPIPRPAEFARTRQAGELATR